MSYNIIVHERRLESLFGTAYPSLCLSKTQKCSFIGKVFSRMPEFDSLVHCELIEKGHIWKPNNLHYKLTINVGGRKGYIAALALEKFIFSIPRLAMLSPPRFWNRMFYSKRPKDIFLISDLDAGHVMTWLLENTSYKEYQLYNKFGGDVSMGFRNPEHATMFKLTFGDSDIQ